MSGPAAPALGSTLLVSGITVLGLLVAAVWGVSDFLGGLAARRATPLLVVTIAHSLSSVLLVLLALGFHAHEPGGRTLVWAVVTGVTGGGAVILFYRALALGEMGSSAALAGVLTAAVPVVFSWLSEGRPKLSQLLGFAIALAAITLIAYEPGTRVRPRGLGLAAIAGCGFGAFLVASKFASQGAVLWPLAYSRLTSAALAAGLLGVAHLRGRRAEFAGQGSGPPGLSAPGEAKQMAPLWLLAGSAGILEAAGNLLYMVATLRGRLDVAAVLSSLYPAGPILLGAWLLRERATRIKALGIALALAAVAVISL